jgi:hypothetical protein
MPATTAISPEIEHVVASIGALATTAPGERAQLMARWREYLSEGRIGLQRQADLFEALYRDAVHAGVLQEVKDLAAATLAQKEEEAGRIQPLIEILVENLSAHCDDPDLSFVLDEALEIARETLKNFDVLHDKLLSLTSEREGASKILRARPVGGEIDHTALSREFMARFPKIRAALGE